MISPRGKARFPPLSIFPCVRSNSPKNVYRSHGAVHAEAEPGVHGADRSVDQAGACHANAVLEVFRRWPAIRRSHQMVQDFPLSTALPDSLAPCDAEEGGGNHRDCTEHDQMDRRILIDEG